MAVMEQLVTGNPDSKLVDEVQFRRGESFFAQRKYRDAENAYQSVAAKGAASEFFEPALFKLGWSFYKQGAFEEALHRYFALIDHKVAKGYVLGAKHTAAEDRRVEDTFNVIALSFSNLGGPEAIGEYFAGFGHRPYEDHAYRYLGDFYLSKQRYQDAATVYKDFVALYPFHAASPDFSLRIIGIYETGGFPQLVVEAKREFATNYGLKAEYWQHQAIGERPEVVAAVKSNLMDLANYYHARYQDPSLAKDKQQSFAEATRWYGEFLDSFHDDPTAPGANYQFADLLRENGDFRRAADAVRAYGLRVSGPREGLGCRLRGDLRAPREPQGGGCFRAGRGQARHRGQFAAFFRHLPAARAGADRAGGRRAGSVRPEGLRRRA
jgi:TolA-binding protein